MRWAVVAHYEGLQEPLDGYFFKWQAKAHQHWASEEDWDDPTIVYTVERMTDELAHKLGQQHDCVFCDGYSEVCPGDW